MAIAMSVKTARSPANSRRPATVYPPRDRNGGVTISLHVVARATFARGIGEHDVSGRRRASGLAGDSAIEGTRTVAVGQRGVLRSPEPDVGDRRAGSLVRRPQWEPVEEPLDLGRGPRV